MLTSATGDEQLVQESAVIPVDEQPFTQRRAFRIARGICVALFPSMQDFWSKSIVGKATALLCVPAILLLNLTLPVVDSEADDCASLEEKEARDAEAAQLDSYRDYDSNEGEESGLQDSYFGPYDGLLVDTEDPEHPRDSHHPLSSQDARIRRELAAKALHNRVLPHAAANAISGAEIPSPWISTTPLETPSVADGLHHALAKFTFAAGDSFVDRSESRTGTPDAVDAPVTPKKGGSLTVSSAKLDVHADVLTRWLTAIQCTLGPVFCVTALLSE
jgi:sodium/potassium/calcium exchanger 6